ncbi:DUF3006 domain-containing protein [Halobacillus sp. BAB-2008]|uniref:DUF3006 domain-containing protein n=1 Tax=Halobacillus sp. BAB-2008 TaxID=1246484 RepID=UPI0002A51D86|nr:DUF3006 domain-containing protein [Halobacillus sp. BAB-2008]ELK47222.1 hypothetical protein D479_07222 [Halobacillus sp. BAB-2008]
MSSDGKYTVDQFEGDYAVLLFRPDESIVVNVKKQELPPTVKEGDILHVSFNSQNAVTSAVILEDETKSARKTAEDLIKKLRNK